MLGSASAVASTQVDRGLTWLSQQPQTNGTLASEAGSIATPFQARSETVVTLKQFAATASYTAVADSIAVETATTTEYAARQVTALAPLGRDVSGVLNSLLAIQNPDGGFGFTGGYPSNPLDTAYALIAMRAAASSNATAISKALGYLTGAQAATDGSFAVNGQPSIFVTALALQALNGFAQSFSIGTSIGSAKNWLVGQQAGGAYSTVLDNAVAAIALAGATLDTSSFAGAQAALTNAQAADGSWSADPYLTALALRALAATASAPPPATTGQIVGSVVDQVSGSPLAGVQVQASGPQAASATSDSAGNFSVSGLAPGAYNVQVSKAGYATLSATVTVTAGVVSNVGTIRLQAGGTTASVQGVVRDTGTGQPLAGVAVQVSGTQSASAMTDATGAFSVAGLAAGSYSVQLSKAGYTTSTFSVTLSAGVTTDVGTITLQSAATTASLQGIVRDGATAQPLSGVTVAVGGGPSATTDAAGAYLLTGLIPGTVTIAVSKSGYQGITTSATLTAGVTATFSPSLTPVTSPGPTTATLLGKVVDAASGLAIANATIQAGTAATTSSATGDFSIAGLAPGSVSIQVSATGYVGATFSVTLAAGSNNAGNIPLSKPAASITLSGRVSDAASSLPIGGATVRVNGSTLSAQTNSNGSYQLAGITQNSLTLAVSAAGYQTKTIAVTLPTLADATVDAALDKVPAGTLAINRVTTDKPVYDPFAVVELDVSVQNSAPSAANVIFKTTILDATGAPVLSGNTLLTQVVAGPSEVELETHLTRQAAGSYSVVVQGFDPATGSVVMEGSTAFTVAVATKLTGSIVLDPPILQFGAGQSTAMTANVSNGGNAPLPAGDLELTIKLDVPDTQVLPQVSTTTRPLLSGPPATSLIAGVFDAAGNLFLLNSGGGVIEYSSQGVVSSLGSFPSNTYLSKSLAIDSAGVLYALNISNNIVKFDTVTKTSPGTITTNIPVAKAFSRDAAGNFYIAAADSLWKIDSTGASRQQIAGAGLATALGITTGSDGNLYVANQSAGISKIDAAGNVTPFASGINSPTAIVQGPDGMFYVTATQLTGNSATNVIVQISADGATKRVYASGSLLTFPRGLRFDAQGNLFVASSFNNTIVKIPPGGGTPQVFAKNIVRTPGGMAYDSAGNLYVVSVVDAILAKLDTGDNISGLATLSNPQFVAANASDDLFISVLGGVKKRAAQTGVLSDYATSLQAPQGVAVDTAGVVYVAEQAIDQVTRIPSALSPSAYVRSFLTDPIDVRLASNGDRYVLNNNATVALLPAAGAPKFLTQSGSTPVSFTLDPAGGFYVLDPNSVKRYTAQGVLVRQTTVTSCGVGIAVGAAGDVLCAEAGGNLRQIDANGTLVTTPYASFGGTVVGIVGDGAGGVYAVMGDATGQVKFLSAAKVLTVIGAVGHGSNSRVAYDAAANEVYVSGAFGISAIKNGVARVVTTARTTFKAMDFANGTLFAVDPTTRELVGFSAAGVQQGAIAGFKSPTGIAWNGADLIISDTARVLRVPQGSQYPEVLINQPYGRSLVVSGGYVYGASGANVIRTSLDPSLAAPQRTSETVYTTAGLGLVNTLALRGDGALAISSNDNSVEVIDLASKARLATYAGLVSPNALAVDATGNVYVGSTGSSRIIRFQPDGKRASVFANSAANALTVDSAGNLYSTEANGEVYRYTSEGSKVLVGRASSPTSVPSGGYAGLALGAAGEVFVTDGAAMVQKLAPTGNLFLPFASGIVSALAIRPGPDGSLYVANGSNVIVKFDSAGRYSVVGSPFTGLVDIAVSPAGRIFASSASSDFAVYDTTGLLMPLPSGTEQGISTSNSLVAGPAESLVAYSFTKVVKNDLTFTPGTPPAGTVVKTLTKSMSSVATGNDSVAIDFGSFQPPYAGEYSFALRPLAPSVQGNVANALHVGPSAQGTMTAAVAKLPAGDSTVGVSVRLTGADNKSIVKISGADTHLVAPSSLVRVGVGADAAGNVYFTSQQFDPVLGNMNVLSKAVPGGAAQVVYKLRDVGSTTGMLPVDDQGNLYMVTGATNNNIQLVPLSHPQDAVSYKTFADPIIGMAIDPSNRIVVLTRSNVFRIKRDTAKTVETIVTFDPAEGLFARVAVTTDGVGNIYVQSRFGGFSASVVKYAPDGSATTLVHKDAMPQFEGEGVGIAGDCASNLFMTPFTWPAFGQGGEEYTLVHVNGTTGAVNQIIDGRTINSDLTDLDTIVYDRFSQSLLIWTDLNNGDIYRVPAKCGAINADLHVVFAANQPVVSSSVPTKTVIARPDGSREYVWNFNDVTALGSSVTLDTTLPGLQVGQTRAVASEAFITFQNTFVAGELRQDIRIPTISVDGMVDMTSATDQPEYPAETDVHGSVTLANRDPANARGGNLDVRIVDGQGALVAVVAQQAASIAAGASSTVPAPFNTGTILEGSYRLVATLTDPATGTVIATSTAGFDVVSAGTEIITSVTTDKTQYQALDTVSIDGRVKNASLNAITGSLAVALEVRDPNGNVILNETRSVPALVPQSLRDSFFTLKLNAAPAGSYAVTMTTTGGANGVDIKTTSFKVLSTVDTGSGLTGATSATAKANRGDPVTITASLQNQGNAALANLPISFKVVNPQTGQLMTPSLTGTTTVPQGGRAELSQSWDTSSAAPGLYIAATSATFSGREISLGQAAVVIGAIQPFSFAARTNVAISSATQTNLVESDPIMVAGIVAPARISVTIGEYRIGSGAWVGGEGFVNPGDIVTVRVAAAAAYNTSTTATLTIAGTSAAFTVTTVNPRTHPDPFAFTPLTGQPFSTSVQSNPVTITGIDIAVPISIVNGEYRIGDGPWTTAPGTVSNGDLVTLRLTTAATLGTLTTATLTVSDFPAPFNVTTTAVDDVPDAFSFAPQQNVPVSTLRTSNEATITGINVSVPIAVAGGEYSVNGGPFTTAPGTVASGNKVVVRHTSSATFSKTVTTTLTVSHVTAIFESTTEGADTTPDPLSFADKTDLALGVSVTSDSATVSGINTGVDISVTNGEYSVNDGPFTSAAGTVHTNDKVRVRQTSASTFATTTTATLTVGNVSATFKAITKAKADVKALPSFSADARVLILLSCKLNGASDADDDVGCVSQRQTFLDGYLTSLALDHRIVTTTEDFRTWFRSGRYDTYWISGGALKLRDTLAEEVREAAFRGETVILDGVHDQRNGTLDEVAGVAYRGKPTGLDTVTLTGAMLPSGTFTPVGAKPIRVVLTTGVRQAQFNTGDAAVVTSAYGAGAGLLFSFDLAGTLAAQPSSSVLRGLFSQSLEFVAPPVPLVYTLGAYVPLSLSVKNLEPVAVTLVVTATLPGGFSVAAGAPPATVSGNVATWNVTLEAGASDDIDWAVRTPDLAGSYSIPIVVQQTYGSSTVQVATQAVPIEVRDANSTLAGLVSNLQALTLTSADSAARNRTVTYLQSAQSAMAAANWTGAITELLSAVDAIDGIASVDVSAYQKGIDGVLKEAQRRWWSALPTCPATPNCRP